MVKRDANQSGSRKNISRGGHPSRGGPTVGGGTKTPPRVYKSPTPKPRPVARSIPQSRTGPAPQPRVKPVVRLTTGEKRKVKQRRVIRRVQRNLDLHLEKKKDTDTHIGSLNIEAELEGRGGVSKAAEFVKKQATSSLGQSALKSAGVTPRVGNQKIEENFTKDVVDFGAQSIPGAYGVGAGAVEAVQGRPKRINKIIDETKKHDPIYLAATGKFKKAGKEIEKHPGLFAAEVSGVGSAGSKLAGAGVRGAAKVAPTKRSRRRLRKIGNTKRAPKVAPGTGMREPRSYPKGLIGKTGQYALEQRRIKKAKKLRQKAKTAASPTRRAALIDEANRRDPRIMSARDVARRTNEREDLAEINRRQAVGEAATAAREVLPKDPKARRVLKRGRKPVDTPTDHRSAVTLLVAQKVVKPNRESVRAYRDQINRELKSLDGVEKRTAVTLRNQLNAALADKRLDFEDLTSRAKGYSELVAPRQKALVDRGMLAPERERKAKLVPYAVQEMGAKWNPKTKELTRNGQVLKAEGIEAHMRSNGADPDTVPFVTQAPNAGGARDFYSSWAEPKNTGGKTRTGEATRKGTFAVDREIGTGNVTRMEGLIKGADSYTEWVGENAYRGPRGKGRVAEHSFDTRDQALKFAADNLADSPYEWTAVPTRPLFGRSEQSRSLLERADAEDSASTQSGVQDAIVDALKNGNGDGKFVLVPKVAADTQANHARFLGSKGLKITRKVGRQFSGTVLTTSGFTWPIGNAAEGTLRLAVIRAGPASNKLVRMTIEELRRVDPDAATDFENRIGTGHLGSYEMQRVHTVAKEFQGTTFEPVARAAGAVARTPGPKQIGQAWNAYTRFVFGKNGSIEHQLRLAAAGRHLKNEGFRPNWPRDGPKAMQKAAEQAARGMRGTNEQVMAARFVDRAMGRYSRWSPEMRFTIAVFTPFVAWFVNAVKFFVDVLPRDHPVLLGLIASSERATEEWRKSYGLGMFVDGAAPLWMQPSIPHDGKLTPVGRYTPAGAFADPLETGAGQVMPAISGILLASKGLDWRGEPLNGHDRAEDATPAERAAAMAKAGMGSMIPFFGLQERVRDKGVKALNPVRSYEHNPKMSAAFDETDRLEAEKKKLKDAAGAKGTVVDSDHPTPEYARLHRLWRKSQETIYRESKGLYGYKFKEPYEPTGKPYKAGEKPSSGGSGGGWDQYREGGGGGKKGSGWDQYRSAAPGGTSPVRLDAGGVEGTRRRSRTLVPRMRWNESLAERQRLGRRKGRRYRNYLKTPQADFREDKGVLGDPEGGPYWNDPGLAKPYQRRYTRA